MANRSTVTGSGSVVLGIARTGHWICTPPLSISIVCWRKVAGDGRSASQQGQSQTRPLRPVIADSDEREDYQSLRGFNGRMALSADQLQWRGLNFTGAERNQQPAGAADGQQNAGQS